MLIAELKQMDDALISLKPRHVTNIIEGSKKVELRNRVVNIKPGTRLWIYSTLPEGYICAYAVVHSVVIDRPSVVWGEYRHVMGITKQEFDMYTKGRERVSVIKIKNIYKIEPGIDLYHLKKTNNFQPPQFMKWLSNDCNLLNFLKNFLESNSTSISMAW